MVSFLLLSDKRINKTTTITTGNFIKKKKKEKHRKGNGKIKKFYKKISDYKAAYITKYCNTKAAVNYKIIMNTTVVKIIKARLYSGACLLPVIPTYLILTMRSVVL